MELRHLEHFVAVAEERHFTRAAARLHIVQSGLSASIRSLERELGVRLFLRTTQRVELTEAGRALLGEARRTLAAAAAARDAVLAVEELTAGRLSVGVMQTHRILDIPGVLGRFHRRYPRVELSLQQAASDQLAELLRTGQVEVAFLSAPAERVDGLELTVLYGEDLLLACAPDHPLADRELVELAELADVPFADFPVGWGTRRVVDQVFTAAGLQRRSAFEMNDIPLLLAVVAEGLAVGFVPAGFAPQEPGLRFVPVRPAPYWEIALGHAAGGPVSAAGRALCAQVRAEAGAVGAG